jgi:hypothetical protein
VDAHLDVFARDRLDDEIERACALHDARGALTSVWARPVDSVQDALLERVAGLLRDVGAPPVPPWPVAVLWGALAELAGEGTARLAAETYAASGACEVSVPGSGGFVTAWTRDDARAARVAGADAWRRARVRVASRLCGVRMRVVASGDPSVLGFGPPPS